MRCQVLVGTQASYRPCWLPARRIGDRNVCVHHRAYRLGRLPFAVEQLPTEGDRNSNRIRRD